jgi:hypothetical protein
MREIVFLLEESSMEETLKGLLPRILGNHIPLRYIKFEGKQDLEKKLPRKLKGYLNPDSRFVVLRDQDSGDCITIKRRLKTLCEQSNKPDTLVRIVCRELESWFLGDLAAIEAGLDLTGLAQRQGEKKFRNPDNHNNAKQILTELTDGRYRRTSSAREISYHLDPQNNTSHSFRVFVEGVKKTAEFT